MNIPFQDLVQLTTPIHIMDVGAAFISEVPVYKKLLDEGIAHLNAFEGDTRQLEKIQEAYGNRATIFSEFLSDGSEKTLYVAAETSGMTSLLQPRQDALKFFNGFEVIGKIERTALVQTKRLDEVPNIPEIDFLKMDIQGSELDVLKHGRNTLQHCLGIQLEVSYFCLYEKQPTFGEVDVWMRHQGYVPHCFLDVKRWSITPTIKNNNFRIPFNQLLESDIVYIKDPLKLDLLSDEQLKKLAAIAHYCFSSYDLCVHVLLELIARKSLEHDIHQQYVAMLGKQ